MFTRTLKVTNKGLINAYRDALFQAPDFTRTAVNRTVNSLADELLTYLRRKPGSPHYPLVWTSDRQRRFVIAKLKREGNYPYRRRQKGLAESYHVVVIYLPEGASQIEVQNDDPVTHLYVKGIYQQKMHEITGWDNDRVTFDFYSELMADEVETDLIKAYETVG